MIKSNEMTGITYNIGTNILFVNKLNTTEPLKSSINKYITR